MASTALLWAACIAGATFPPMGGAALAVFVSPSHSNFLFALAAVSWGIQLLGWTWSAANHSEQYYDLLGSVTFISLIATSLLTSPTSSSVFSSLLARDASQSLWQQLSSFNTRQLVNSLLVLVWAIRLGSHLFARIRKDKKDNRFDMMRDSGAKLLLPWMTQGLWAFSLSLPVTLSNGLFTAEQRSSYATSAVAGPSYAPSAFDSLTLRDLLGWSLWLVAFTTEVVADRQKSAFAANPGNKGKFIDEGLWSVSRHPNYLGEMSMWFGLFLSCSSAFTSNSQYLSVAGPCFNAFLLLFVSGVPLLEKSSDAKFGKDKAYQEYKQRTPVLLPRLDALAGLLTGQPANKSSKAH